jgi:hypothetical protein
MPEPAAAEIDTDALIENLDTAFVDFAATLDGSLTNSAVALATYSLRMLADLAADPADPEADEARDALYTMLKIARQAAAGRMPPPADVVLH